MDTTATNEAARQDANAAQVHIPQERSHVGRGNPELTAFEEIHVEGERVRIDGPRGPSKDVYTIKKLLGNGTYELNDGKIRKEKDLRSEKSRR